MPDVEDNGFAASITRPLAEEKFKGPKPADELMPLDR